MSLQFVLKVKSAELAGKFDEKGGGTEEKQRKFLCFHHY